MKKMIFLLLLCLVAAAGMVKAEEKKPFFQVIQLEGVITSPSAKYVAESLEAAVGAGVTGVLFFISLKKLHAIKVKGSEEKDR